jgi:hypothetical protein
MASNFTWSATERVYKLDGTTVPSSDLRSWMLGFLVGEPGEETSSKAANAAGDPLGALVRDITQQFVDGKINMAAWQISMESAIKTAYSDAAMMAYGGRNAMTAQLWGRVGAEVRNQYSFFRTFSLGVANGDVPIDGRMPSRAELYISGAYGFYENSKSLREQDAGATEERRILAPGNNCDDCIAAAELGWQPIGTLPEIGDSACMANCHCEFEQRGAPDVPAADQTDSADQPAADE